jgi:hypothetical protein
LHPPSTKENKKGPTEKQTQEREKHRAENGISSYWGQPTAHHQDLVASKAVTAPKDSKSVIAEKQKSMLHEAKQRTTMPQTPKKPAIKIVRPPQFHAVRATINDNGFVDRLKVREFVLKCLSIFCSLINIKSKRY